MVFMDDSMSIGNASEMCPNGRNKSPATVSLWRSMGPSVGSFWAMDATGCGGSGLAWG
jgi:hypothetical protein